MKNGCFRALYLTVSALAVVVLLQGCSEKTTETISQPQLQTLVNESFLSPQIRSLALIPGVGVQLYLTTPKVSIRDDQQPLAFTIDGSVDMDFMGNTVTERLPLQISGVADLVYKKNEQAFYFQNIQLSEARLNIDVVMFETLIIDQLKKAIVEALVNIPVISLDNNAQLLKEIGDRPLHISVVAGELQLSFGKLAP